LGTRLTLPSGKRNNITGCLVSLSLFYDLQLLKDIVTRFLRYATIIADNNVNRRFNITTM
jgi:hypothetical protein